MTHVFGSQNENKCASIGGEQNLYCMPDPPS